MEHSLPPQREDDMHGVFLQYAKFKSRERFIRYTTRAAETDQRTSLPWKPTRLQFDAIQGVQECLRWGGLPLFKTAFDFALYPMLLWEVGQQTF
jgi:hypothetical protein